MELFKNLIEIVKGVSEIVYDTLYITSKYVYSKIYVVDKYIHGREY